MFPTVGLLSMVAATLVAAEAGIPKFDVETLCREIVRDAHPVGNFDTCVKEEDAARDRLVKEWAQFSSADKSDCVDLPKMSGMGTYTQLLTCLELVRDARRLREAERDKAGARKR
jgi:hypothetical protein